jgi:hypothetical protein
MVRHPFMQLLKRVAALFGIAVAVQAGAASTRFTPPAYQAGDEWLFGITIQNSGGAPLTRAQTIELAGLNSEGLFLIQVPSRGPGEITTVLSQRLNPNSCFFMPHFGATVLDKAFCAREVPVREEHDFRTNFVTGVVTYRGVEEVDVTAGTFNAHRFTQEEQPLEADRSAPSAVRRRWDYWYVPESKIIVRARQQHFDAGGRLVRTVVFDLYRHYLN